MSDTRTVRNLVWILAAQGAIEELYDLVFSAGSEARFEVKEILPLLSQNQLNEMEDMVRDRIWRDKETKRLLETLW